MDSRLEIEREISELERVGMERRYDRPDSGADFDAHIVGYHVAKGVNAGAHEPLTPNEMENCDAQQSSYTRDGTDK